MREVLEDLNKYKNLDKNTLYKTVAAFILKNSNQVSEMSISDIAAGCFTNKSSITRFCQSLGFQGYKDFSFVLKLEIEKITLNQNKIITPTSSDEIFKEFHQTFIKQINSINSQINKIVNLAEAIMKASDIYLLSSYENINVSEGLNEYLLSIDKPCWNPKNKKTFSFVVEKMQAPDLMIIYVSGVDNEYLMKVFESLHFKENVFVVCSQSQSQKFSNLQAEKIIIIDPTDSRFDSNYKEIYFNYINQQIINIINSKITRASEPAFLL
ncbi:MurR/RpiR family transcriptional regulator [Spiroplasma alleghenense]|uniref:MurR/RpiR family transcriptional regulator n=1 Tax=Spiroplasma alleghenense TaxID=216931 RepID=A0A345Z4R1_9MOLU|nr:MurR/RpiR family transcriptional regulator [Spiroplasma alleghenense]AXK51590.1 MurR/RpiR family transcriptional regulator [Spiroplasma alleghenense]